MNADEERIRKKMGRTQALKGLKIYNDERMRMKMGQTQALKGLKIQIRDQVYRHKVIIIHYAFK